MPVLARARPAAARARGAAGACSPIADAARRSAPATRPGWHSRPPAASEHAAIDLLIAGARVRRARAHRPPRVRRRAADACARRARAGVAVTVETCPHYLTFAAEEIADGATAFKCAPPIRERRSARGCGQALAAGDIDFIATDHSPAPPALKHLEDGDFRARVGRHRLAAARRCRRCGPAMARREHSLDRLARWLSAAPARAGRARTPARAGSPPGCDADLVDLRSRRRVRRRCDSALSSASRDAV